MHTEHAIHHILVQALPAMSAVSGNICSIYTRTLGVSSGAVLDNAACLYKIICAGDTCDLVHCVMMYAHALVAPHSPTEYVEALRAARCRRDVSCMLSLFRVPESTGLTDGLPLGSIPRPGSPRECVRVSIAVPVPVTSGSGYRPVSPLGVVTW